MGGGCCGLGARHACTDNEKWSSLNCEQSTGRREERHSETAVMSALYITPANNVGDEALHCAVTSGEFHSFGESRWEKLQVMKGNRIRLCDSAKSANVPSEAARMFHGAQAASRAVLRQRYQRRSAKPPLLLPFPRQCYKWLWAILGNWTPVGVQWRVCVPRHANGTGLPGLRTRTRPEEELCILCPVCWIVGN